MPQIQTVHTNLEVIKKGKCKLEVRTRGRLQEFEDPYANHKGP